MITRHFLGHCAAAALFGLVACGSASAYPEFQKYSQTRSGRTVNCAMCHANPDGPDGAGAGQIGGLKPDELERLNKARAAFEPGQPVDSPILNAFGSHIIQSIGKTRFLEMRSHPEELALALGDGSDIDGDGVPDAQEYVEGTNPLDAANGNPWRLFVHNLSRYRFHVVMILAATVVTIFGLANILRGAHASTEVDDRAH